MREYKKDEGSTVPVVRIRFLAHPFSPPVSHVPDSSVASENSPIY